MERQGEGKRTGIRIRWMAVATLASVILLSACQSGAQNGADSGSGTENRGEALRTEGEAEALPSYKPEALPSYKPVPSVGPSAEPEPELASRVLNERVEASDVKWVYMTWPLQSNLAATLYSDRDAARISQIIDWIEAARPIDGTGLTIPIRDRSMAVNVELQDGRLVVVRPAWRCTATTSEKGNANVSCEDELDRIVIEETAESGADAVFAESAELYRFLNEDFKAWMSPVQKYEYPDKLKPGAAFAISGHGARSQSATVTLSKGDAVLWTGKSDVRDGEWKVEGKLPDALASGKDYCLQIQTDEGGTTVYPDVE
ncbi:hypothetical protein ACFSR7_35035 [Cohnella sp. GCM10020058]|uniref:hypothetical protein n=1 Tax=Cohnella sp. GCM10020058 TaxID=3317330 RepID=UPI0036423659